MAEPVSLTLVAGPGVEPGLEDYALPVILVLPQVSDYIITPKGAWRLVSTDSPPKGIASVLSQTKYLGCPPIQPSLLHRITAMRAHTTSLPCSRTLPRM